MTLRVNSRSSAADEAAPWAAMLVLRHDSRGKDGANAEVNAGITARREAKTTFMVEIFES